MSGDTSQPSGSGRLAWIAERKLLVGIVAAVVIAAVVVTVVLWPRPEDDKVVAAAVTRDPVPTGPLVTSIPADCGVRERTMDELVSGGQYRELIHNPDSQNCTWDSGSGARIFGGGSRDLEIDVSKDHEDAGPRSEWMAAAFQTFDMKLDAVAEAPDDRQIGPVRPVSGLGDEAVVWHALDFTGPVYPGKKPEGEPEKATTTVLFRQGNVVVQVAYGGVDYTPHGSGVVPETEGGPPDEAALRAGAFLAARDVAAGMGLRVSGKVAVTADAGRKLARVPDACDLLPDAVAERLAPDADPEEEDSYLVDSGEATATGGCDWDFDLVAEVAAFPDSRRGSGERVAIRRYLELHAEARGFIREDEDDEAYFRALTRPGEQAYVSWTKDSSVTTEVVFRTRNVLVRVTVRDSEDSENSARSRPGAVRDAYDAAVAAARSFDG
ncbi:MAG: hypothetical protein GEV10_21920 [Streptosporangiales bacterium]|nr:hypothetical protein [Streptosporangiales bacterium]